MLRSTKPNLPWKRPSAWTFQMELNPTRHPLMLVQFPHLREFFFFHSLSFAYSFPMEMHVHGSSRGVHGSSHGGEDLDPFPVNAEGKQALITCIFPECPKTFTRQSDLQRHIDTIHIQKQRFWCPHSTCKRSDEYGGQKKSFARRDKRDEHARKIHLKGKLMGQRPCLK